MVTPIPSTVRFPLNPVHVLLAADQNTGLFFISVALMNQILTVDRVEKDYGPDHAGLGENHAMTLHPDAGL